MSRSTDQSHKKSWGAQVEHGVERKLHLGNTNTPEDVARLIARTAFQATLVQAQASGDLGWWLEPAVGVGNFYFALLDLAQDVGIAPLAMAQRLEAIDIDPEALAVLRQRLRERYGWDEATVAALPIHETSLVAFTPAHAYRGILTNPPYLAPKNWATSADARARMLAAWQTAVPGVDARADLFVYFFHWCHRHLEAEGRSVFLCSDGWLDASYGASLRSELTSGAYALDALYTWPWKALFRDDTCPIVTVVRRGAPKTTLVHIDDRDPLTDTAIYQGGDQAVDAQSLPFEALQAWLDEGTANRRQRLVTDPTSFAALEHALDQFESKTARLDTLARLSGFSVSAQDLLRGGVLLQRGGGLGQKGGPETQASDADWAKGLPLFFQRQARVGKPVDYRQMRTTDSLECRVLLGTDEFSTKVGKGQRTGGVWLSLAIDRFPLAFVQDPTEPAQAWVGVSKYVHLAAKQKGLDSVLAAVLTSTPVLLTLDRYLKEGTRKTLRVNENGYAKEVRKSDLEALNIPDFTRWSADTLAHIQALQLKRGRRSLARLDAAVNDADWQAIDALIAQAMGLTPDEHQAYQRLAVALYWRRMRNTVRYGEALHATKG